MDGPTNLAPDFREFIQFANSNEVRFLIVVGYAVAFYGIPDLADLENFPEED